jgi:hypothetical protein
MPKTQQQPRRQLEFDEPTAMQWEDLSAPGRARVREHLARLLRQAAGGRVETSEGGDDE